MNGHAATCEVLLQLHANMEALDKKGCTALLLAVINGHAETCKVLIRNGANLESKDQVEGRTPLLWAVQNNHTKKGHEICEILIESGADVEAVDERCRTALYRAVCDNSLELCKILLKKGALSLYLVNFAASEKHAEILKELISNACYIRPAVKEAPPAQSAAGALQATMISLWGKFSSSLIKPAMPNTPHNRIVTILCCLKRAGLCKDLCYLILTKSEEGSHDVFQLLYPQIEKAGLLLYPQIENGGLCPKSMAVAFKKIPKPFYPIIFQELYKSTRDELALKFRQIPAYRSLDPEIQQILAIQTLEEQFGWKIKQNLKVRLDIGISNMKAL